MGITVTWDCFGVSDMLFNDLLWESEGHRRQEGLHPELSLVEAGQAGVSWQQEYMA